MIGARFWWHRKGRSARQERSKAKIKEEELKSKNSRPYPRRQEKQAARAANPPADLGERILEYGTRIVKVVGSMPKDLVGRRIVDQLPTCGLSVGANFEEAQAAESRNDFVHKLQIALKELRESCYWLKVVSRSGLLPETRLAPLLDESGQLVKMLSKAVARAKGKARNGIATDLPKV